MNAALQSVFRVTQSLFEIVRKANNEDEDIAEIERLLDEREQLLPQIEAPATDEEREVAQHILKMNEAIERKLAHLLAQIQKNQRQLELSRTSVKAYLNPYENQVVDGVFLDKKK